ncbi:MAG: response regulator transcription factor [Chloroflexi bacterium]|nr:response regulator transcription factor [Chloroflexota bacterium]
MARILVVDDEPHIVGVVTAYLEREGHTIVTAGDGERALAEIAAGRPDLVVLDVMLPRRSGFDVLRELRARGETIPVILLTARDELVDRVAGLEIGADDYVAKPFEPRELVARVGAILRRASGMTRADLADHAASRRFFDLDVDLEAREALRDGAPLGLTRVELDLLAALTAHPGVVQTREQLGAAVFGEAFDAFDRTIDSHVKNLRRKLGPRPDGGGYVETVRGVGYRAARR